MPEVASSIAADLAVGDIIQTDGPTVSPDLRDKYFIVRAVTPEIVLSWPYVDAGCTVLYVPRVMDLQTERDWRAQCEAIDRREKKANKAIGLVLKSRDPRPLILRG